MQRTRTWCYIHCSPQRVLLWLKNNVKVQFVLVAPRWPHSFLRRAQVGLHHWVPLVFVRFWLPKESGVTLRFALHHTSNSNDLAGAYEQHVCRAR